jgi:hypothetical protein
MILSRKPTVAITEFRFMSFLHRQYQAIDLSGQPGSVTRKKDELILADEERSWEEVDFVTEKKLSTTLEALKGSFETSVKASNENFDAKINNSEPGDC